MSTIVAARITAQPRPMPQGMFDPMPEVHVTIKGESGEEKEHYLFMYYPDELSFTEKEFIGLSLSDAKALKFKKDVQYLKS